eukprot:COSAG02_NODE_3198_length_7186_cov_9.288557_6_plen_83_part_01
MKAAARFGKLLDEEELPAEGLFPEPDRDSTAGRAAWRAQHMTPGSTPASLWYTHIGLACCMVVVAFFAPRRFSAHRSEKRLVW